MSAFLVDNKVVFIHVPKTGGASIRKGLIEAQGIPISKGHRGKFPAEWSQFPSIAIVRHPLDRFISAYHMMVNGYKDTSKATGRYKCATKLSIEQFSKLVLKSNDPNSGQTSKETIAEHTLPQTHLYNLLQYANFIYRYEEDYDAAIDHLFRLLDRPILTFSQRWNETERKDWREYNIPDEIKEYYKRDFEEFKYERI